MTAGPALACAQFDRYAIHAGQPADLAVRGGASLVLLSVIIVGQNVLAAAADKRAEATYNDADAVLHEAVKIQEHLLAQDKVLGSMIGKLDARRA